MRLCVVVSVSHGPRYSEMRGNLLMFHHRALTIQLLCQSRPFTITSANSVDHTFHVLMRSEDVVMIKLGGAQNGPKCQWDTNVSGLLVWKHQPLPTNLVAYYALHVPGACKRSKDGRWRCPRRPRVHLLITSLSRLPHLLHPPVDCPAIPPLLLRESKSVNSL